MADYAKTASGVLKGVGGEENVQSVVHCATRLRFVLKDESRADTASITATPGVITTARAGGQYQVVIGNDVPLVYAEISKISKLGGAESQDAADKAPARNPLNRFVTMISAIFLPFVWVLAGTGLIKAFLAAAVTFGWLDTETSTYTILNAAGDAFLYFLPIAIAITAAKHFRANQFTSLAIAGAMVYPAIVGIAGQEGITFVGIPVVMINYVSSVIPIIIVVWLQGYAERWLTRLLPGVVRNFLTPMIVILVFVPVTFLVIGPISSLVSTGFADGVDWLFTTVPWLGGAVLGGLWQVLVIFGLHWGMVPLFLVQLTTDGFISLTAPVFAAVLAQAAATAAVLIRSRNRKLKELAAPAAFSGFLAGITEPAIYGVNLPLKRPFAFGLIGGAVGGAIVAASGAAANAFVFPSLLAIPALLDHGNLVVMFIGLAVAIALGFVLTLVFGFKDPAGDLPGDAAATEGDAQPAAAKAGAGAAVEAHLEVLSPLAGTVIPLAQVNDAAFAEGALGQGVAIVPRSGALYAPFDAEVAAVFPTGHAIGLRHADGAELLIHVGLDTVRLKGEHFAVKVEAGRQVKAGDLLLEFDTEAITRAGYDLTTPVIVTNDDLYPAVRVEASGPVEVGEPLMIAEQKVEPAALAE